MSIRIFLLIFDLRQYFNLLDKAYYQQPIGNPKNQINNNDNFNRYYEGKSANKVSTDPKFL